jgi:hypothetical protein
MKGGPSLEGRLFCLQDIPFTWGIIVQLGDDPSLEEQLSTLETVFDLRTDPLPQGCRSTCNAGRAFT